MTGHETVAVDSKWGAPPLFLRRLWVLVAVLLIAGALRAAPLTDNRFHPDEALFATLGRMIISGDDPLLTDTVLLVDKPPLLYLTLAGGISIAWGQEISARLPNWWASLLSVALTARLADRLWRSERATLTAAWLVSLSPFTILFAPTAFADQLMVMWGLAALVAAVEERWWLSGILVGMSFATKQSGSLWLPLPVILGVVVNADSQTRWHDLIWRGCRFVTGLGLIAAFLYFWELLRGAEVSFWTAGVEANNPGRFVRSGEVWERARRWLGWLHYLTANRLANSLIAAFVLSGLGYTVKKRRSQRQAAAAWVLSAALLAYLALHWFVAFPLLDRYLLPLIYLVVLLAARGVGMLLGAARPVMRWSGTAALAIVIAVGSLSAMLAAQSEYPVGGDHGAFDGIDRVGEAIKGLPVGSVVYYEDLGWSLAYYLYDAPVYLAPVSGPTALTADLRAFREQDDTVRVLVLPVWRSHRVMLGAVEAANLHANVMLTTENRDGDQTFVVYRLLPDS